ncbi:hypothetical protein CHLRE_03g205473v5 [Chlamydomonas reinhardtii]|uniref:Uncharacterized protein n=1 Tax=Chlamydomonas reinhardtii TaxID=3055 RepID=A0A2K3DZT0_CHLRE|nr:uncharacterized protein CHLRE_03g205473v5 [Chlamydomonas reinhardtii]PNW86017.1 hypothetical protein CHLRE_03g205473v5 [Chlamydomonas reinhardtii]
MCVFREGSENLQPTCSPSALYTAALFDTVGKEGSQSARSTVLGSYYSDKCSSYTPPAGRAACRADRTNRCYVPLRGSSCRSSYSQEALDASAYCPGTKAARRSYCMTRFVDECTGECTWSLAAANIAEAQRPALETANGGPILYGACFTTEEVNYYVSANNTLDRAKQAEWTAGIYPDLENPDTWDELAGTCSVAISTKLLNDYSNACLAVNVDDPESFTMRYRLNVSDFAASVKCQQLGCAVSFIDFTKQGIIPDGTIDLVAASGYQCVPEPEERYRLVYREATDYPLLEQLRSCSSPVAQFDRAVCESMKPSSTEDSRRRRR